MLSCVAFDFDGTLVLSNDLKREGFFVIAERFPGGLDRMERLLADPPGDRSAVFERFSAEVGGDWNALVDAYTRWCDEGLRHCALRPGAETALAELGASGTPMYVNSATPSDPLRRAVLARFGPSTFAGIHGGYGAKAANLQQIMMRRQLAPHGIVMVGDGLDDREAAQVVGCRFIGVDGGTLSAAAENDDLLRDLNELIHRLHDDGR